jgi:hypothetical protein
VKESALLSKFDSPWMTGRFFLSSSCRLSTFLFLACLTSSVLVACKIPVSNKHLTRFTRSTTELCMHEINMHEVTGTLAPDSGNAVDYAGNSKKVMNSFVEYNIENSGTYVNVTLISKSDFKNWTASISSISHEFLESIGQSMKTFPGLKLVSIPIIDNFPVISTVAFYDDSKMSKNNHRIFDGLWSSLKNKTYCFTGPEKAELNETITTNLATSWALSTYKFQYYKSKPMPPINADATLVWPPKCDRCAVLSVARAYSLMKELVNTPALNMGPAELEAVAVAIGKLSLSLPLSVFSSLTLSSPSLLSS